MSWIFQFVSVSIPFPRTINATSGIAVAAGGTFAYNSSTALTKAVTLNGVDASNRAVLGGTGTVNAAITLDSLGDVLSPGNSPGIQTYTPAQTWSSFSYDWEVNDFTGTTAGTAFDQLGLSSTLDLTGFSDPDTGTWGITQSGNNLVLSYTAIPEPGAALLGGLGLLTLLRRRRNGNISGS